MRHALFSWTPEFTQYNLSAWHALKPERLLLTHSLISSYGLLQRPDVICQSPEPASLEDLLLVHSREYVEAVRAIDKGGGRLDAFRYGFDGLNNPIFDNMYDASARYCGASIQAAQAVLRGEVQVAFNIAGGLHHAHRDRAAGFCVFNDAALAIAWLLKETGGDAKILYLDIDAHHGDGVQEAFYDDPRVLTISLHEVSPSFFPGTGYPQELGRGKGEGYSVNIPFSPFTADEVYMRAFEEIVPPLVEAFKPDFFISQLGADAHYLDPIAELCLTTADYERLFAGIREMAGNRWIALGGGGYSLDATPRIWTLAFANMLGVNLDDKMPPGYAGKQKHLRDRYGPDLDYKQVEEAREFAEYSIKQIRELIFPYHGL